MLQILRSKAQDPNPALKEEPRKDPKEDNVEWLKRFDPSGVRILLFGGRSHESFRLRIAQAHARDDMSPSHWSHAALVVNSGAALDASTLVAQVPLEPEAGHTSLLAHNGVEEAKLEAFRSSTQYPNVAVLRVEADAAEVERAVSSFRGQRSTTDAVELAIAWLAFVCGVGRVGNPLLDGLGIPSAVLVESVLGVADFELTPSLPNRSSCPESIWQAAKWWHDFHAKTSSGQGKTVSGAACLDHDLGAGAA